MAGTDGKNDRGKAGLAPRLSDMGPSVTIHAQRSSRAGVMVGGVELNHDGVRIKLTFEEDRPVDQVFGPEMADAVISLCARAPQENGLLSLPDLHVVVEGCELKGAAILSRVYAEQVTAITIRIRRLQGNAVRLLTPGLLRDDATSQALERAVDDAIERIYLPLRNFEHSIDSALQEISQGQAERLHAQILAFRTEIDNVCYNFERLLADDLARIKARENQEIFSDAGPKSAVSDADTDKGPPTPRLRVIPGSGG